MSSKKDSDKDSGSIMYSRGASADAFGKLDGIMPEFRIDAETALLAQRAANESGCSIAEICRTALRVRIYGKEHVQTVAQQHLSRVIGNVGEMSGQTGGAA